MLTFSEKKVPQIVFRRAMVKRALTSRFVFNYLSGNPKGPVPVEVAAAGIWVKTEMVGGQMLREVAVLHSTIFIVLLGSALLKVSEAKFKKLPIISVKARCSNKKLTPGFCNVDRSFYRPTESVKESFIKIIALKKAHFDITHWLRVHSSLCHIRQYIPVLFSFE